ncbi:DUF5009 domain-containing protein [Phormidium yuhuli AB48]|uniref:DUF5009 domain-containing protein n=1 Tax=Phormidium yuhuli AB48 TaxID=2940671 RepID=A0ABY5AQ54_9CYAN|nr:DUF5009 domain-containing protein [Phormidium yuhuli]USR91354.1 DUF5009 domain-containing protein [Phormidium yuhuli AB48]
MTQRSLALDSLRGLAVLAMVFSGIIPFGGALPAWMYHAQVPPPDHVFNPEVPGLTWVDVVFPAFLFALGAAIPLAQRRRIEQGWPGWKIALSTLWRGLSLIAFAVFLQHCRPNILDPDLGVWRWWISLLGFLILGLAFGEFPPWIPRPLQRGLNLLGWLLGIILLSQLTYADGSGFSSTRHDIILVVLGNVAIAGTAIWWLTRDQVLGRLGAIALVFALQLSLGEPGWVRSHLDISPIPHLLNLAYLKYLLIVLPATLIGDGLWQMLHQEKFTPGWTARRYGAIALLGLTWTLTLLIGLQGRWLGQTLVIGVILTSLTWWLKQKPYSPQERLLSQWMTWGTYWIALGVILDPVQGGIKKDPATWSYLFTTTGISIWLLVSLLIVVDIFRGDRRLPGLIPPLIDTGRNPLVGYVAYLNLILPLLTLTGLRTFINAVTASPLRGTLRALIMTMLVVGVVWGLKQLRWRWRL